MAMLLVLETLAPTERAVFVLREVFDLSYDEIAEAVGKTPAAVRQIAHRARDHVAARRPRMHVDPTEQEQVIERFIEAFNTGDLQSLMDVLAPDVVAVADGGGQVRGAARRPIVGAEKLVAYLAGGLAKFKVHAVATRAWVNGEPGVLIEVDGQVAAVVSLTIEDGRITRTYSVANPQKLAWLDTEAALAR
jgi:RNA polymerase sigma-70 factor (ECF subfamily)